MVYRSYIRRQKVFFYDGIVIQYYHYNIPTYIGTKRLILLISSRSRLDRRIIIKLL